MSGNNIRIAVASGKGGTGKTTVSVNLFHALHNFSEENVELVDCDVEEPNANLFLKGEKISEVKAGIRIPVIQKDICTYCGRCAEVCAYNAIVFVKRIPDVMVMPDLCHGCGACTLFCPERAITEKLSSIGKVNTYAMFATGEEENSTSPKKAARLVEGRLDVGATMPTPVIRAAKKQSSVDGTVIFDAPPGTSCNMVETVEEADYVLLVTEPTPFGLHDLDLAWQALVKLKKPMGLVINRADLGTDEVRSFAEERAIPVLLEIPYDERIARVYAEGKLVVQELPEFREKFIELFRRIETEMKMGVRS